MIESFVNKVNIICWPEKHKGITIDFAFFTIFSFKFELLLKNSKSTLITRKAALKLSNENNGDKSCV